jgi:hypothetical protein
VLTFDLTASGRDLVAAADAWRRLPSAQRAAVTDALGLLVGAAGDDYGITPNRPVPL